MSDVLTVVASLNWWLVAIIALVLAYAALVLVALGYIDGRWAPRSVLGAVAELVVGILWLPVVVAWVCYQAGRVLLRGLYAVVMFFFNLGDGEASRYLRRQRESGLPF